MFSVLRTLLTLSVVFASFSFTEQASAQEVRLEARLTGSSLASGKATFRQKGRTVRLSVEIEDASRNTDMVITAIRGDQVLNIGSFTTDAFGFADLNRAGASATVLRPGDIVEVRAGATLVVSGTVRARR